MSNLGERAKLLLEMEAQMRGDAKTPAEKYDKPVEAIL